MTSGKRDQTEKVKKRKGGDGDAQLGQHEGDGVAKIEGGETCFVHKDAAEGREAVRDDNGKDAGVGRWVGR